MPRPIEYIREEVLNNALMAFWRLGYSACSFQVLIEATGMSRQGIYNTFGDKDGFFREVIVHYKSKIVQQCQQLEPTQANLESLSDFIKDSLKLHRQVGPGACFIVITAFSQHANDPMIKPVLDEGAAIVRKSFSKVLSNEQKTGKLTLTNTPQETADYLYCIMNGLSALAQTGGLDTQIETSLNLAFQSLRPNKET